MSRPGTSQRPSYIALPSTPFGRSPNGSPLNTPGGANPAPAPIASPTSPRNSFLPSFMRNRSRAATITGRGASPNVEAPNPLAGTTSRGSGSNTSTGRDGGGVTRSVSTPISGGLAANSALPNPLPVPSADASSTAASAAAYTGDGRTHRIRLVPHLESSRSLAFDPVVRELASIVVPLGIAPSVAAASVSSVGGPLVNGRAPALLLKIGRFTDKTLPQPHQVSTGSGGSGGAGTGTLGPGSRAPGQPASASAQPQTAGSSVAGGGGPAANTERPATGIGGATIPLTGGGGDITSSKVAFKSKVVSRAHAEIWCEPGGKFFIRDTASSSGTFLNHIRLSSPNTESRPTSLKDGDVLQLGVDYQGGQEDLFRCVKMRVELGREWQRGANEFNTNALKQLKALGGGAVSETKGKSASANAEVAPGRKTRASVTDCCICLFSVTVCQSLFIAPCSHVFHYKCIRPLLMQHHPGFSCPLCRTFANLEEDVETEDAWEIASRRASVISRRPSNHSIRLPTGSDPAVHPGSQAREGPPSSGVGFGPASASVDELLAGESGTTSEEGGTAAPGPQMDGSSALARQTTAVQDGGPDGVAQGQVAYGDVDMPEVVPEEVIDDSASGLADDPAVSASLAIVNNPSALSNGSGNGNGNGNANGNDGPSVFDAQTPRNDTFLSTLAPGMAGMAGMAGLSGMTGMSSVHQRLDLAEEVGDRSTTTASSRGDETRVGEASRNETGQGHGQEEREDVDMMFS